MTLGTFASKMLLEGNGVVTCDKTNLPCFFLCLGLGIENTQLIDIQPQTMGDPSIYHSFSLQPGFPLHNLPWGTLDPIPIFF